MRAFSILQNWPEIAKMTTDDPLTLKMVSIEPPRKNEQKHSFSFIKFVIFGDLERRNEFHGNHASYSL